MIVNPAEAQVLTMNEIQTIFRENRSEFLLGRHLPVNKIKVMRFIEQCRTASLGAHIDKCNNKDCDYKKISYNSCRNRHCPQCQNLAKEQWLDARKCELINVNYFHVVFTMPDLLNPIIYNNQKSLYSLMFKCVSETLTQLALDKKYLGAQIGVTAILHTWGQNLMFHPHIHCIVPGGGLSASAIEFVRSRKKFFIPVKVLSRKFRGKFLHHLKCLVKEDSLKIPGDIDIERLIKELYDKDWVTFCKPPFKSPEHVINYLGRYTHKIAISNSRIVSCNNGEVTFKWRDYKNKSQQKLMSLPATEFMRRFLLHVLPDRFVKIRYYGIVGTSIAFPNYLIIENSPESRCLNEFRRILLLRYLGIDILGIVKRSYENVNRLLGSTSRI